MSSKLPSIYTTNYNNRSLPWPIKQKFYYAHQVDTQDLMKKKSRAVVFCIQLSTLCLITLVVCMDIQVSIHSSSTASLGRFL